MQKESTSNKWKLFSQWVLVNTIGVIVAIPIITILIISITTALLGMVMIVVSPATLTILTQPLTPDEMLVVSQWILIFETIRVILSIIIPSILLGVFQWLVLRTQITDSRKWILVSFIGLSIGLSISAFGGYSLIINKNLPSISLGLLSGGVGAIIGTTLGIAQWFFLHKHVKYSSLWILGSIVSFSVATNVTWGLPSFLGLDSGGDQWPLVFIFTLFVLLIRLMCIYSVTSGVMLIWMLNHPIKELQMATTA